MRCKGSGFIQEALGDAAWLAMKQERMSNIHLENSFTNFKAARLDDVVLGVPWCRINLGNSPVNRIRICVKKSRQRDYRNLQIFGSEGYVRGLAASKLALV